MSYGLYAYYLGGHVAQESIEAWVESCDVDAYDGRGTASFTHNPSKALRFSTASKAIAFWQQQSTVRPLREDGLPNRPLTAFTCGVQKLPV